MTILRCDKCNNRKDEYYMHKKWVEYKQYIINETKNITKFKYVPYCLTICNDCYKKMIYHLYLKNKFIGTNLHYLQ